MRHLNVKSLHLVHVGGLSSQVRGRYLKDLIAEKVHCPVVFIETFEAWEKQQCGHVVIEFESEKGVDRFLRIEQDWLEDKLRSHHIAVRGLLKESDRNDFFAEIHNQVGVDLLRHDGKPPSQWSSAVELRRTPAKKRPNADSSHFGDSRRTTAGSSRNGEGRVYRTEVKRMRSRSPDATPGSRFGETTWRGDRRLSRVDSTPARREGNRDELPAAYGSQSVQRGNWPDNFWRSARTDIIPPLMSVPSGEWAERDPAPTPAPTPGPASARRGRSLASFGSKAVTEGGVAAQSGGLNSPPSNPSLPAPEPRTTTAVASRRSRSLSQFSSARSRGSAISNPQMVDTERNGVGMELIDLELLDTTETSPEKTASSQLPDGIPPPTTIIPSTVKEPCMHSWVCSKCGEERKVHRKEQQPPLPSSNPVEKSGTTSCPVLPDCPMEVDGEEGERRTRCS